MIDAYVFENDVLGKRELSSVLSVPSNQIPTNSMVWIDMEQTTQGEDDLVFSKWLKLHDTVRTDMMLANVFDDATEPHFPSVEEFEDHLFVVLNAPLLPEPVAGESAGDYLRRMKIGQLNIFITERAIITHHPVLVKAVMNAKRVCTTNQIILRRGPDYFLAMILDSVISDFRLLLDKVDLRTEELEQRIFKQESMIIASRLLELRRIVQQVRRSLTRQDEVVYRLSRGEYQLVNDDEAVYYRDVHDNHIMSIDHVDSLRDSITGLMEVYFSMSSSRLNQVMRVLTVISTIFLPITFIVGVYGMNFRFMPEIDWVFGYPLVLLLIAAVSGTMLYIFKKRGWLG